jgi:hypothetical protein
MKAAREQPADLNQKLLVKQLKLDNAVPAAAASPRLRPTRVVTQPAKWRLSGRWR